MCMTAAIGAFRAPRALASLLNVTMTALPPLKSMPMFKPRTATEIRLMATMRPENMNAFFRAPMKSIAMSG